MLEEALSSTTCSPAEAALAFSSFLEVELVAGGAAAESRFFKLFSLLCNRVFGTISEKDAFKHEVGGWLSRPVKWENPNTSIPSTSAGSPYRMHTRPTTPSNRVDPVIKLLGARAILAAKGKDPQQPQLRPMTLIESFAKEAAHRPNVRYPFPFEALPKSTQDAWMALIEVALGGTPTTTDSPLSENATRLLGSLFRVKPIDQLSLRQYQQGKAHKKDSRNPLPLSPMHFRSPQPMSPRTTGAFTPTKEKDSKPMITISMLEYFLLVFLRYPLAPPPVQQAPQTKSMRSPGVVVPSRRTEPYGDTVYYQLFQEYVEYYVPYSQPVGQSGGFASLDRPSELFVRITVELWLEAQNRLWPSHKAIKAYQDRRGLQASLDLHTSFELVKTKYDPPQAQISRCLSKLIVRAVSDGAMLDTAKDMHAGYRGATPEILCLSPTMTILQLPVYNYIRNAFRHATLHSRGSPFYYALNDWLVWLEPWNVRHEGGKQASTQRLMNSVKRTTTPRTPSSKMFYPRGTHKSAYKPEWEPYIASNLYLYVVPLAIFLRRARELDFSPREHQRSMNTVRRVFRVFTPEVVGVINKLLLKEVGSKYAGVVARHETNLGPFAPPVIEKGLASCQDDMQNLLEEMYLQHHKRVDELDVIDRSIAYVESWFGTGADAGEEKELRVLFEKAKPIVGFPKEHEIVPSKSRANFDSQARSLDFSSDGDRKENGFLSESGVEKVNMGLLKCNPLDIAYVGDRMNARAQSYEYAPLVDPLVELSQMLNARLGLSSGPVAANETGIFPRRINLRFLASKRMWVTMAIPLWWLCKYMLRLIFG